MIMGPKQKNSSTLTLLSSEGCLNMFTFVALFLVAMASERNTWERETFGAGPAAGAPS